MATVIDKLITNKNKTNVYFKLIYAENTVIGFKPPTPLDGVDFNTKYNKCSSFKVHC